MKTLTRKLMTALKKRNQRLSNSPASMSRKAQATKLKSGRKELGSRIVRNSILGSYAGS